MQAKVGQALPPANPDPQSQQAAPAAAAPPQPQQSKPTSAKLVSFRQIQEARSRNPKPDLPPPLPALRNPKYPKPVAQIWVRSVKISQPGRPPRRFPARLAANLFQPGKLLPHPAAP